MQFLSLVELGFVAVLLLLIGGRSWYFSLRSDDSSLDGSGDAPEGDGPCWWTTSTDGDL